MHEYLRAVGFQVIRTKKQSDALLDWVLSSPDFLNVVSTPQGGNVAEARRTVCPGAGIEVVGEMDDDGKVQPEIWFPYVESGLLSSTQHISFEPHSSGIGYMGMCEDERFSMALIFNVRNPVELVREESDRSFHHEREVYLTALAKDGTVLLPLYEKCKVTSDGRTDSSEEFSEDLPEGFSEEPDLREMFSAADVGAVPSPEEVYNYIRKNDIYTLVQSFFMPHGMSSDTYYFMGEIRSVQLCENRISREKFYRLIVVTNGMPLTLAVNEKDLTGVPEVGYRIKCHAWLSGDIRGI